MMTIDNATTKSAIADSVVIIGCPIKFRGIFNDRNGLFPVSQSVFGAGIMPLSLCVIFRAPKNIHKKQSKYVCFILVKSIKIFPLIFSIKLFKYANKKSISAYFCSIMFIFLIRDRLVEVLTIICTLKSN